MEIKFPNCGCEYEPAWNDPNDCPMCGNEYETKEEAEMCCENEKDN